MKAFKSNPIPHTRNRLASSFSLTEKLAAADEVGEQLFVPPFAGIRAANDGSVPEEKLRVAFAESWRVTFDAVPDKYGNFVEVTWQPEIARLRVSRVVSVMDVGRILNPLAGRNQIEGAVVMGIGMALFEHTSYDPQTGAPINSNLADS